MWDFSDYREVLTHCQQKIKESIPENGEPRHQNEEVTEARVQGNLVVQWVADGHKVVVGHHCQ
jgi:hypothetical protein